MSHLYVDNTHIYIAMKPRQVDIDATVEFKVLLLSQRALTGLAPDTLNNA